MSTGDRMLKDFQLIFENAINYNFNYSIVAIDAKKLLKVAGYTVKYFSKELETMESELVTCKVEIEK